MKVTTREVKFRDPNGRMVSSLVIGNGSLHDEVADYLDNNPEPVATATGEWLTENITQPTTPVVDASLSVSGAAADSKKVGDELSDLKSEIQTIEEEIEGGTGSGLTSEIKSALMGIAEHILMWSDGNGPNYISALRNALYPPVVYTNITLDKSSLSFGTLNSTQQLSATTTPTGGEVTWSSSNDSVATVSSTGLVTSIGYGNATITASCGSLTATCSVAVAQATVTSISASYNQGTKVVYESTVLDSLKDDLTVTASWSNGTTSTVASSDYTLSGTLTEGTSTITVSYGGQTATFNVTVSAAYEFFDYVYPVKSGNDNYVDTGLIHNSSWATLNVEFKASNTNTNAGSSEGLFGANNIDSSDTSNMLWYGRAKRGGFSTYSLGVAAKVDTVPADEVTVIKYFFVDGGESYIMYGDTRIPVATLSASSITPSDRSLLLAGCYALSGNNYKYGLGTTKGTKLGYIKFSNPSNNEVLYNFVPAHNLTTDKYGYYETVNGIFYPAYNDGLGCGNWE